MQAYRNTSISLRVGPMGPLHRLKEELKNQFDEGVGSSSTSKNSVKGYLCKLLNLRDESQKTKKLLAINEAFKTCFKHVNNKNLEELESKQKSKCYKILTEISTLLNEVNEGLAVAKDPQSELLTCELEGCDPDGFKYQYAAYQVSCNKIKQYIEVG